MQTISPFKNSNMQNLTDFLLADIFMIMITMTMDTLIALSLRPSSKPRATRSGFFLGVSVSVEFLHYLFQHCPSHFLKTLVDV